MWVPHIAASPEPLDKIRGGQCKDLMDLWRSKVACVYANEILFQDPSWIQGHWLNFRW